MRAPLALLFAAAALSCNSEPIKSAPQPTTEQNMPNVQTDLAALRKYLSLPPGDFSCRWVLHVRDATRGPNANDMRLSAYVELPAAVWPTVAVEATDDPDNQPLPAASDDEILLSDALANALLPAERVRAAKRFDDRFLSFHGTPLAKAPLTQGPMHISRALRVGDALLVSLASK